MICSWVDHLIYQLYSKHECFILINYSEHEFLIFKFWHEYISLVCFAVEDIQFCQLHRIQLYFPPLSGTSQLKSWKRREGKWWILPMKEKWKGKIMCIGTSAKRNRRKPETMPDRTVRLASYSQYLNYWNLNWPKINVHMGKAFGTKSCWKWCSCVWSAIKWFRKL